MTAANMHEGETPTSVALVRRLLTTQFPEWADLHIEPVSSSGTVNALYRLGEGLVVRLPRMDWAVGAIDKEQRWLPGFELPVHVAVPLAKGEPGESYPYEWGVYPWLDGEHPKAGRVPEALIRDLARLVQALQGADMSDGAPAGRGAAPLAHFDKEVRGALDQLDGAIDTAAAGAAWRDALRTPGWSAPPVWTHGDLMPANLLVQGGVLTGVIDWECMGLGDPACDLAIAWNLLSPKARALFRAELGIDDATWARGRGWALWTGLVALPYYRETNPELAENARYRIEEVLTESAQLVKASSSRR